MASLLLKKGTTHDVVCMQGCGGGQLSKETGDMLIVEGVPLSVVYGSYAILCVVTRTSRSPYDRTEAGIIARYFPGT